MIDRINKATTFAKYMLTGGLILLGTGLISNNVKKEQREAKQIEVAKDYLKNNANDKYIRLLEKGQDIDLKTWENAVREVQDSLRVDSLCKKAYFEGAQMVRDSIAKANFSPNQIIKAIK